MRRWYGRLVAAALIIGLAVFFRSPRDGSDPPASAPRPTSVAPSGSTKVQPKVSSIAGTVVDDTKQPIAGARVCAFDDDGKPSCVATDAAGAFAIREPAAGTYRLVAGAAHHIPAHLADVAADRRDVVLILPGGGVEVSGTVSDRGGGAISHARVSASVEMVTTPAVEADDRGNFDLWSAPGTVWLDASADGYVDGGASDKAPAHDVAIVLEPESVLAGIVIDASTKQPVGGAKVCATSSDDYGNSKSGTTEVTGRFELRGVSAGRYGVTARARGGYGLSDGTIALSYRGRTDGVTIELHPAGAFVGKVLIERFYQTGGKFHLDGLAAGHYELVARTGVDSGSTRLDLAAGEHATAMITIDRSLTVTGRILDLVGHGPVTGMRIFVHSGTTHRGESGGDGRFVIHDVQHGALHLDAYSNDYVGVRLDRNAATGATIDLGDLYTTHTRAGSSDYRKWGSLGLELAPDRTIRGFEKGSPAPAAGLVVGDVVTAIDGIDVTLAVGGVVDGMTIAPLGTIIRVTVARGPTYAAAASSTR